MGPLRRTSCWKAYYRNLQNLSELPPSFLGVPLKPISTQKIPGWQQAESYSQVKKKHFVLTALNQRGQVFICHNLMFQYIFISTSVNPLLLSEKLGWKDKVDFFAIWNLPFPNKWKWTLSTRIVILVKCFLLPSSDAKRTAFLWTWTLRLPSQTLRSIYMTILGNSYFTYFKWGGCVLRISAECSPHFKECQDHRKFKTPYLIWIFAWNHIIRHVSFSVYFIWVTMFHFVVSFYYEDKNLTFFLKLLWYYLPKYFSSLPLWT